MLPDPPHWFALEAVLRLTLACAGLTAPANLVLFWVFVSRRKRPVGAAWHRFAGAALWFYAVAFVLMGGVSVLALLGGEIVQDFEVLAVFLFPPALGVATWFTAFRRPAVAERPVSIRA